VLPFYAREFDAGRFIDLNDWALKVLIFLKSVDGIGTSGLIKVVSDCWSGLELSNPSDLNRLDIE
jgi:hypothetical protein